MGTRHLIAVQIDGEYKIAQYGQWDGYPSGQGADVLKFCASMDRGQFAAKCRAAGFLSDQDINELNERIQREKIAWQREWPWLSRDAGSDILGMVLDQPDGIKLKNSLSFASDSLLCEWAYVVDLDAGTLEVFKGFNKAPLDPTERFAKTPKADDAAADYTPVTLVKSYKLDELPTTEQFLADLEPREDD